MSQIFVIRQARKAHFHAFNAIVAVQQADTPPRDPRDLAPKTRDMEFKKGLLHYKKLQTYQSMDKRDTKIIQSTFWTWRNYLKVLCGKGQFWVGPANIFIIGRSDLTWLGGMKILKTIDINWWTKWRKNEQRKEKTRKASHLPVWSIKRSTIPWWGMVCLGLSIKLL